MKRRVTAASVSAALGSVKVIPDAIAFTGGLDQQTPPLQRNPGLLRNAQNFEVEVNGGYRRIAGYERYDGRPKPSDASYSIITATITGAASVGDTLTGATSAATGVIIALPGGSFVLTKVTGTFQSGENLQISAVTVAVATSAAIANGASTSLLHATYRNAAADEYRDDIAAATGSGAILGGFYYNDVNYCFRNNAGGTAAGLFKQSVSGWTAVALGRELSFTSGGVTEIVDGNTITGAISGATAVITRVVLTSGTWAGGDAAGRFVFASQTGTFQAENLDVGASLNLATIAGDSSAITLLPNGRYECVKENFGGNANTTRVYGCDGVNRGFEFDGAVFVPIATGMTTDTPSHVCAHKKHLFFSFGGSVQHSGTGTPYKFTIVTGASEIGMGDTVNGFAGQPGSSDGGALAIFTRNRLSILYGSSSADWNLVPYRSELGAYAHTIQDVGYTVFLDDRGITDIQTSQAFGNFAHSAFSDRVKNLVNEWRSYVVASCISRDRSQYRIYFTNGYGLHITLQGKKLAGIMPVLFSDIVRCAWTAEMNDGTEVMFFGSDAGMVYQMDKGTSFDGDAIEAFMECAYNFQKSPLIEKHYRDVMLEIQGSGYAAFGLGYSLGYGSTYIPQPGTVSLVTSFSATFWDSFVWDAFIWDGQTLMPSTTDIDGDAENISLAIRGNSDIYEPHTFSGAILHYTPRRRIRP